MRIETRGAATRQLRTLFNLGAIGELTDGQLLERFSAGPREVAELAFAALVERHSSMVGRVCSALLADPHDAQDAAQATFLVLVRRARGLWVRDSLGPWLHRVASRVSMASRSASARRRRIEGRAAVLSATPIAPDGGIDADLRLALHAEIARLPERYRVPLVLCDLEGRTCEQAARLMGRPVGTVKSWRARGRERLRLRLIRRGLAPSTLLGLVLDADAARVRLALPRAGELARLAARVSAGRTLAGVVPASISILVHGGFRAMHLGKVGLTSAVVLAAIGLGTRSTGVAQGVPRVLPRGLPQVPVVPVPTDQRPDESPRPLTLREALRIAFDNTAGLRVVDDPAGGGLSLVVAGGVIDTGRVRSTLAGLVRSIGQQYWALAAFRSRVSASQAAIALVEEIVKVERTKLATGASKLPDVAEAEEQLERFKLAYVSDTSNVITAVRQLRVILGIPAADGRQIVPTSVPITAALLPDWQQSLAAMTTHQPDVVRAAEVVRAARVDPGPPGANDRSPAGKQADTGRLEREEVTLGQVTNEATHQLARFFLEIDANAKQLATANRIKEAARQRMDALREFRKRDGKLTVDRELDAINRWSTSIAEEAVVLAKYNATLIAFEEAKGTLLEHEKIRLNVETRTGDGPAFIALTPGRVAAETPRAEVEPGRVPRATEVRATEAKTYTFRFAVGSGPRPTEVRGSFTVGPPAP